MKREEILRDYEVNQDGIITSPGKFEGEMFFVPYFWNLVLNGGADEEWIDAGDYVSKFYPNNDDVEEFPELEDVYQITLWEDSQGFVRTDYM